MPNQELALLDKSYLLPSDIAIPLPKSEDISDYHLALHMTGVKVLAYETFDDYQGTWLAHIEFPNGERYFIHDYYGSCSGCDEFQARDIMERKYNYDTGQYEENLAYAHELRDFGREYLTNCMTEEQTLAKTSENLSWDHDAEKMVTWVKEQLRK